MIYELDFRGQIGGNVKKLVWATDLHLDAVNVRQHRFFFDLILNYQPDAVLIGGDISNGANSLKYLRHLSKLIHKPFYFVLGNHDFYYGSIVKTRKLADQIAAEFPTLRYLTSNGVVPLTEKTALIGHDGWADGRAGNFLTSTIQLNDYFLIEELKSLLPQDRLLKLNQFGSEAADFLQKRLLEAFMKYERVILLTHVPPFQEACIYEGHPSDDNWAPHFVSFAVGEMLRKIMQENPAKEVLVLCGHSHFGNDITILPNLRVVTGHSELGAPSVQGIIFIN